MTIAQLYLAILLICSIDAIALNKNSSHINGNSRDTNKKENPDKSVNRVGNTRAMKKKLISKQRTKRKLQTNKDPNNGGGPPLSGGGNSFPSTYPSSHPTAHPSLTPTEYKNDLVGTTSLSVAVSLYLDDTFSIQSYLSNEERGLLKAVSNTATSVLCQNTNHTIYLVRDNSKARDVICGPINEDIVLPQSLKPNYPDRNLASLTFEELDDNPIDSVNVSKVSGSNTWFMFRVLYRIVQLGSWNEDSLESIKSIRTEAQNVVNESITTGVFKQILRELYSSGKSSVIAVSVAGLENSATIIVDDNDDEYDAAGAGGKDDDTDKDGFKNIQYYQPLDPAPLHPIRIAGIVLLLFTVSFTSLLFGLAKRRKEEREREIEKMKNAMGGLGTEEGVNEILDVGRRTTTTAHTASTVC